MLIGSEFTPSLYSDRTGFVRAGMRASRCGIDICTLACQFTGFVCEEQDISLRNRDLQSLRIIFTVCFCLAYGAKVILMNGLEMLSRSASLRRGDMMVLRCLSLLMLIGFGEGV